MDNLAKIAIQNGGNIYPLLIDSQNTNGTGLTNPSIFIDENGKILVNLRHVEYTLFHSEKKRYCHPWGPIQYLHRENDLHLRTNNFLCILDSNYSINHYSKIDTSVLDKEPLWDFIGLEDARIVKWNNKLYLTGVRRDTTTNGEGRMELSEIIQDNNNFKEISRFRIPAPDKNDSYCEKNWMPILDMPFHYIKWCNPLEIVKVDPGTNSCNTVFLGEKFSYSHDFRGGSQIIPYKDNYIALLHIVDLYYSETGRKDAKYQHVFMMWDKNWNLIKFSKPFNFLNAEVEFSCGMAIKDNKFLITLGFQDNSSFLIECPEVVVENFINE
jgi:hypothetical protein